MRVLAVETSTHVGSVALTLDGAVSAELAVPARARHGELLLPNIERLLVDAGIALADIDLLAVGIGPGSFTGLRIGLAAMKGLALGTDLPLVGVGSLEVLAAGLVGPGHLAAVFADAHKEEVFVAAYEGSGGVLGAEILAPCHAAPAEAAARLREVTGERRLVVAGEGLRRYAEAFEGTLGAAVIVAPPIWDLPRASMVATLAERAYATNGPSDLERLEPRYLRGSDAQLPLPSGAPPGNP
jgi:tRNA threonylcarbamoyladenosine biosynthesis protein TsaB